MTLNEIESKTGSYKIARTRLAESVHALNEDIEAMKRQRMPRILRNAELAAAARLELHECIEDSPEEFKSPRTQVFHGIKVGFRKGTGGIDWDDDERTSDLIEKHFPDQFKTLVKTTRKPQAKALASLEVGELKKVACRVESTGDIVVIKPTDSEVDKTVNALLKGAVDEAQREAA